VQYSDASDPAQLSDKEIFDAEALSELAEIERICAEAPAAWQNTNDSVTVDEILAGLDAPGPEPAQIECAPTIDESKPLSLADEKLLRRELESGEPEPRRGVAPDLLAAIRRKLAKLPRIAKPDLSDPLAVDREKVRNRLLKDGLSAADLLAAHPDFWSRPYAERNRIFGRFIAGTKGKVPMTGAERVRRYRAKHATGRKRGRPRLGAEPMTAAERKRRSRVRGRHENP
jgi:hypothetical protein